MATDDGSIRVQDPNWNPSSWLPVYGRWCGPDWSAGARGVTKTVEELLREPVFQRVGPGGGVKVDSPLDELCKAHDIAYVKAMAHPDHEAAQKFHADLDLLNDLVALDQAKLTKDEKTYSKLMALAFAEKIFNIDVPALGFEAVMTAMKDLMLSLHGLFDKIEGLSYMDQFGAMMWGAVKEGDLHGGFGDQEFWDIPFTRFTLTATDTAGASAVISYYADPYRRLTVSPPLWLAKSSKDRPERSRSMTVALSLRNPVCRTPSCWRSLRPWPGPGCISTISRSSRTRSLFHHLRRHRRLQQAIRIRRACRYRRSAASGRSSRIPCRRSPYRRCPGQSLPLRGIRRRPTEPTAVRFTPCWWTLRFPTMGRD